MRFRKVDVKQYKKSDGTVVNPHSRTMKSFFNKVWHEEQKQELTFGLKNLTNNTEDSIAKPEGSRLPDQNGMVEVVGVKVPLAGSGGPPPNISFKGKNLKGMNLSGLDLRGVKFAGLEIEGADFTGADLRGADFRNPIAMARVTVTDALLEGSKWRSVGLKSSTTVDLTNVELDSTSLHLRGTETAINLDKAKFLTDFSIHGGSFSGQDLSGLDLTYCAFVGSNLEKCDLRDTKLGWLLDNSLVGSNLNGATFSTDLAIVNLHGCNLSKTNFQSGVFISCDFSDADLSDVNFLSVTEIHSCDFRNSNLTDMNFGAVKFYADYFTGKKSDFTGAKWTNCSTGNFTLNASAVTLSDKPEGQGGSIVYDQFTFDEAVIELEISPNQFEFLVLSNTVPVRSNDTKGVVDSKFDKDIHHITPWDMEKLKRFKSIF